MKDKMQIQHEVEKTLECLDGIQRAQANPYLFTRVKAALQKEEASTWGRAIQFMGRPVVAIATIILVLLINIAVFYSARTAQSTDEDQQLYASEYFSNSTVSDYENVTNQ